MANVTQQKKQWLGNGILAICLILLALYIYDNPFFHNAKNEYEKQRQLLQWLQTQNFSPSLLPQGNLALDVNAPLATRISEAAKSQGFSVSNINAISDKNISLELQAVPFNQLLSWLSEIERSLGFTITSITISRTPQPGIVSTKLELSQL